VVCGTAVLIASLMSVSDTDAKSNLSRPRQGSNSRKGEKKKYLVPRATSYFHPFVVSTDGLNKEDLAEEAIHPMAEKWGRTRKCGYVNARMSIAIVRPHMSSRFPCPFQ
jgi:hypothetical protein